MLKLISIVDTITNSSDELFIMKSGEQDKKKFLIDFIKSVDTIDNERKEELLKHIEDDYFRYEVCYNVDENVLIGINYKLAELVWNKNRVIPVEVVQNWHDRVFEDIKNGVITYYDEGYAERTVEECKGTKYHTEEYVHNPQLYVFNLFNNRDTFFPHFEMLMEHKERYQDVFDWLIDFFKDKLVIYGLQPDFFWYFKPSSIEDEYEKYGVILYARV